jgi:protein phosphatase
VDKIIPLHSLVVLRGRVDDIPVQTLRINDVREELTKGSFTTFSITEKAVESEFLHRIAVRLDHGRTVVVDDPGDRIRVDAATMAVQQGAAVFYLGGEGMSSTGDGLAEFVRIGRRSLMFAQPGLIPQPPSHLGITVIGDIHGMAQPLQSALAWARSRQHFPIFLGDILDYGTESIEVVEEIYRLVMRNEAALIIGNHERKISRWANARDSGERSPKLSDGNRVTVDAVTRLGHDRRSRWIGRFRALVSHGDLIRRLDDVWLAHAAIHPSVWTDTARKADVESFALFGQPDPAVRPPKFSTCFAWTNEVPDGHTVVVGHDIRSTDAPRVVTGAKGGKTVFLDTGCGKGGMLSTADFRFDENGKLCFESLMVH